MKKKSILFFVMNENFDSFRYNGFFLKLIICWWCLEILTMLNRQFGISFYIGKKKET
jgi:hypothetical protein